MKHSIVLILMTFSLLTAGCGGSSSDASEDYPDTYLQLYNGSANSASVAIEVDDDFVGQSSYGDATGLNALEPGDREIELTWNDGDGQEVLIDEITLNLTESNKTLLVVSGDFDNPDITEFSFRRDDDLEDHFNLYVTSVIPDVLYDFYVAEEGTPFSGANKIADLSYLDFIETTFWNPDEDSDAWDEGEYVIYVTLPGEQEVLFTSQEINFNASSDYILVLRNTSGADQDSIVLDVILNTTSVGSYQDSEATAQYRIYNALPEGQDLDIGISTSSNESITSQVAAKTLTEFADIEFGDYQITASVSSEPSINFNNRLLTLNQGESKTLVVFNDEQEGLTAISLVDSSLPQAFDHEVNVANLVSDFEDVDVYFVRTDETVESAEIRMTNLDYAESRSLIVPNGFYSIVVIYEDALENETLLYRGEYEELEEDILYMLTIEEDDSSATGYRAVLLQ